MSVYPTNNIFGACACMMRVLHAWVSFSFIVLYIHMYSVYDLIFAFGNLWTRRSAVLRTEYMNQTLTYTHESHTHHMPINRARLYRRYEHTTWENRENITPVFNYNILSMYKCLNGNCNIIPPYIKCFTCWKACAPATSGVIRWYRVCVCVCIRLNWRIECKTTCTKI